MLTHTRTFCTRGPQCHPSTDFGAYACYRHMMRPKPVVAPPKDAPHTHDRCSDTHSPQYGRAFTFSW